MQTDEYQRTTTFERQADEQTHRHESAPLPPVKIYSAKQLDEMERLSRARDRREQAAMLLVIAALIGIGVVLGAIIF